MRAATPNADLSYMHATKALQDGDINDAGLHLPLGCYISTGDWC